MQSVRAVLASFAMVSMVGCASQADLQSVRRDSDETKSRIFAIEKGLGEVRGEVKDGLGSSPRPSPRLARRGKSAGRQAYRGH